MADFIRINELPKENSPTRDTLIPIDSDEGTKAATLGDVVKAGTDLATDIEGIAGTNTFKTMTPFTTKATIDAKVDGNYARTNTVITVGYGLLGGGALANNIFINLSQNTIDSLAKADTAAQAADVASAIAPLTTKAYVDSVASTKLDKPINGTNAQFILGDGSLVNVSNFATSNQGTKADNALPSSGGTVTGTIGSTVANNSYAYRYTYDTFNSGIYNHDGNAALYLRSSDGTVVNSLTTHAPSTFNNGLNINGAIRGNPATNIADGIASFYADSSGGSYASIPNRRTPLKVQTTTAGNVYAPVLNATYNTSQWGGVWTQGVINTGNNAQQTSYQLIHMHTDGAAQRFWTFDGTNGRFTSDSISTQNIYMANGQVASDGNIYGSRWGNQWLYEYLQNSGTTLNARAYTRRSDGAAINWYWSGQGGQPTWLWGGTDGSNMYVYNPSNFSVNYANSAGNSSSLGGSNTQWWLDRIEERAYWRTQEFIQNSTPGGVGTYAIVGKPSGGWGSGGVEGGGTVQWANINPGSTASNVINYGSWRSMMGVTVSTGQALLAVRIA